MIPRLALLFLLAMCVPVAGQTGNDQHPEDTPDSLRDTELAVFPLWKPPSALGMMVEPDSLLIPLPPPPARIHRLLKHQQRIGIGMVVLCAALSYHYHQRAEAAYDDYRTSGNPAELDDLFRESQHLDRLAGWCFAGVEAGVLLVTFSIVLAP